MDYKLERLEEAARLEKSGNWEQWLSYCQEWASAEPGNFLAWQGIGDALTNLGKDADAIPAYKRGLEVAPPHPIDFFGAKLSAGPLWYRLGNGYSTLGDYTGAISALSKAAQIDPGVVDIWNNLGIAYVNADKPAEAVQAFKAGISADPSNIQILSNLGILYARGEVRDGVAAIHRMLSKIDGRAATAFMQNAEKILANR